MQTKTFFTAPLLSVRQVAHALGITSRTVGRWADGERSAPHGFPAPVRLGGRLLRFRADDIENFVACLPPVGPLAAAQDALPRAVDAAPVLPKRGRGRPRKAAGAAP